jgi:hypothetical protein
MKNGYFQICSCCDFTEFDVDHMKNPAPTPFLEELKKCIDFTTIVSKTPLGTNYKIIKEFPSDVDVPEVIECLDYLTLQLNERRDNIEHGIYQTWSLHTFICDFLKIEKDSSYDYLLLNYLENMDYTFHGGNICSGALNSGHFGDPGHQVTRFNNIKIRLWAVGKEARYLSNKD